jgi:hypothetical protein
MPLDKFGDWIRDPWKTNLSDHDLKRNEVLVEQMILDWKQKVLAAHFKRLG